jgi:hypothetical protein
VCFGSVVFIQLGRRVEQRAAEAVEQLPDVGVAGIAGRDRQATRNLLHLADYLFERLGW